MANAEITNLIARMEDRNFRPSRYLYTRWRPRSQNVAATRQVDGCAEHTTKVGRWFWDHQVTHAAHGRNIRHSVGRCYFWFHRFPGEAGLLWLRQYISRDLVRDVRWNWRRLKWRVQGWWDENVYPSTPVLGRFA